MDLVWRCELRGALSIVSSRSPDPLRHLTNGQRSPLDSFGVSETIAA